MFTVDVFAKALDRGFQGGCRIRPMGASFEVRSASNIKRWYVVSEDLSRCSCEAKANVLCKHRAIVAYITQRVAELCPTIARDDSMADETERKVSVA